MSKDMTFEVGSGNVFADLGFDNPEEELLKAKLVREISAIIKRRRLTQAKAADLMGVIQPDLSAIVTGRTVKSPIERLARCIDRLGYEIDVVFRHKARKPSRPAKDLTDIQRASAPIPLHSDRPSTPSLIGLARKSRAGWWTARTSYIPVDDGAEQVERGDPVMLALAGTVADFAQFRTVPGEHSGWSWTAFPGHSFGPSGDREGECRDTSRHVEKPAGCPDDIAADTCAGASSPRDRTAAEAGQDDDVAHSVP